MNDAQRKAKIVSSYTDLSKLCKNGEYVGAIKACNRILHADPNDSFVFGMKNACHIQLGNFGEVLEFISKNPKFHSPAENYKKAYCLYRTNQLGAAAEVLNKIKKASVDKNALLAQVYYRMGRFMEAYTVYKVVYETAHKDDKVEIDCNMMAILACLRKSTGVFHSRLVNVDSEYTYELKYNKACSLIAQDRFSGAVDYLESSEKLAVKTLTLEGCTTQEINREKGIIVAQKGFVYQKLGREKEALKVYSQLLSEKPTDETLVAVVSNNLLCISKDKNVFVGKKRLKAMSLDSVDVKLNDFQRSGFALNKCLFYYHTQQTVRCKAACENLVARFPDMKGQAVKIKSALAFKNEGFESAKRIIDEFVEQEPKTKTTMYLALVQQLLRQNQKEEVIVLLKSLGSDSFCLGVVSALVTLYQSAGKTKEACKTLAEAIEYYKKFGNEEQTVKLLWRKSVQLMMADGNHEGAVKTLETLRESSPGDPTTMAQLIIAYSKYDVEKAKRLSHLLPPIQKPSDLDIEALESPNWQMHVKLCKKTAKDFTPPTPLEVTKSLPLFPGKKKRKQKKNKVPANYDPAKTPDPERWLPLYQRSYFKPQKGKKGKPDVAKGSQGSLTNTSDNYEMKEKVNARSKTPDENAVVTTSVWKKDGKKKKKKR